MVVMAITERTQGHRGISAFIVDRGTPGMTAGKKEDKLGMRASETSEVVFEQCRDPRGQLLGREGEGFINVLQVLDAGRIGIAALAVGLALGAYEAARAYALERRQFGRRIAEFDAIRSKLATMATHIEAARLLTLLAAFRKDQGHRLTHESAVAKLYASEMAVRAAEDCVQIHGGYGFIKDYPAEKFFRDVKLTTMAKARVRSQRLVIARQLLGNGNTRRLPVAHPGPGRGDDGQKSGRCRRLGLAKRAPLRRPTGGRAGRSRWSKTRAGWEKS